MNTFMGVNRTTKNYYFVSLSNAVDDSHFSLSTINDICTSVIRELEDMYADDEGSRERLAFWWFKKVVPGILGDQREVLVCLDDDLPDNASTDDRIIGFSILKKTPKENKFTLYVDSNYDKDQAVIWDLVNRSFNWFGNRKAKVYIPGEFVNAYPDIFTDENWDLVEKGPGLFSNDVYGGYLGRPRH